MKRITLAAVGMAFLAPVLLAPPAGAEVVGKAAAVNTDATASGKKLVLGAQVIRNEKIVTDATGSVQLLFLDRTTMNVGPNSVVVIDNYVYNPSTGVGSMSVTMTKGLMRFVGGSVTHEGRATLNTPSATMGIRGGTAQFSVGPKGTQATFLGSNKPGGGISIRDRSGKNTDLIRPGFMSVIGDFASPPSRVDPQALSQQNGDLGSRPGAHGGAGQQTSQQVANLARGHGATVASNRINTRSSSTGGERGGRNGNDRDDGETKDNRNAAQENQLLDPAFQEGAFVLDMTNCCAPANQTSVFPYLPAAFFVPTDLSFIGYAALTPVLGYHAPDQPAVTLQYGFEFGSTTGGGQTSALFIATGTVQNDGSGGTVYFGSFLGSSRLATDETAGFAGGTYSSGPGGVVVDPIVGLPTGGTVTQNRYDTDLGEDVAADATYFPGDVGTYGSDTTYPFEQNLSFVETQEGLGDDRPAVTLNGYAAGLMQTFVNDSSVTASYALANQTGSPTDVVIVLDPVTGLMQANIDVAALNPPPGGIGAASYQFGTLATFDGTSAYIDYEHFGALAAKDTNGLPVSTIDSQAVDSEQGAMVAVRSEDAVALATATGYSGGFCECAYTRWGAWSVDSRQFGTYDDRSHMNWWVAGRLPNAGDVPTSGTASYEGHAVASIDNNGAQYVAAGTFSNTVDFGNYSGNVTVGGLDGSTYTGTVTLVQNATTFGGTLSDGVDRTMALDGSFFVGPTSPVGEMGGQLTITGTDYLGAGVFAATQVNP